MRQEYAWRSLTLAGFMALVAMIIIVQIFRIQSSPEAAIFKLQASQDAQTVQTFYPQRGEIYDRSGHLLAGNKTVYEIGVELANVKDKHAIALAAGVQLGLNPDDLYQQLANPPANAE